MDIEVLLESFDGAFAPNTLRAYRNLLITGVIAAVTQLKVNLRLRRNTH